MSVQVLNPSCYYTAELEPFWYVAIIAFSVFAPLSNVSQKNIFLVYLCTWLSFIHILYIFFRLFSCEHTALVFLFVALWISNNMLCCTFETIADRVFFYVQLVLGTLLFYWTFIHAYIFQLDHFEIGFDLYIFASCTNVVFNRAWTHEAYGMACLPFYLTFTFHCVRSLHGTCISFWLEVLLSVYIPSFIVLISSRE